MSKMHPDTIRIQSQLLGRIKQIAEDQGMTEAQLLERVKETGDKLSGSWTSFNKCTKSMTLKDLALFGKVLGFETRLFFK